MKGGKLSRSQRIEKKMSKTAQNSEVTESAEHGGDGDGDVTGEANAIASTSENSLLEALALLSKEFKDFRHEVRRDLSEFKDDVKKALKDDLAEFKGEVLRELQSQNASIEEAQARVADLESACIDMKEVLVMVARENAEMRDKLVDLESRSRRNNIRIYGVPEEKEGQSVTDFVTELFKRHLTLPEGVEPQIQRAHRALIPKPAATSPPRSIIVNFLQFHVKELILRKAWQQKIEMNGKRLYFDNDYATDIMERRKAYGPIKAALKEKGIRFQTPFTKIRVHWDSGMRIYGTAEEAAQDLNRRGIKVTVRSKASAAAGAEERLNAAMPWKRTNTDSAAQRARQRLTEFRRGTE